MDTEKEKKNKGKASPGEELGIKGFPICREPWESYYILRRGILPCCHGSQPIAPMSEWKTAWNSPQLQEIRKYLSHGKLSPYCLTSLSCPIVQKYLAEKKERSVLSALSPEQRPPFLRLVNRLLFRIPAKVYRAIYKARSGKS